MPLPFQRIDLIADDQLATRWNRLWRESDTPLPVARYEHLLIWQRHFAPRQLLQALVVTTPDGEWLAALPLSKQLGWGGWPVSSLPMNAWSFGGDLLWNPHHPAASQAMAALVQGVRTLRRPWLWLDAIARESLGWQAFAAALRRQRLPRRETDRYQVGLIRLRNHRGPLNWEAYQQGWSGNFRRQMRKMIKRADEQGGVALRLPQPADERQVADYLRQGFEIENQGWKREAGTSVCRHPKVLAFFIEQARQLHRDGQLQLVFLDHQRQPIAFEYGWLANETYFSPKVGYDENFAHLSPGQLLRYHLIAHLLRETEVTQFDFLGPVSPATARWATHTYPIRRLICSNGSRLGDLSLRCLTSLGRTKATVSGQVRAWARQWMPLLDSRA